MTLRDAADLKKPALRQAVMARRDELSPEARAHASQAIAARCNAIVAVFAPQILAGYLPIRTEVDPRPILDKARAAGAEIALPAVLNPRAMVFRRYLQGEPMMVGGFGTLAPTLEAPVLIPDLIIIPLVGFDRTGMRLGHGAGFYDRAIGAMLGKRPPLLGIAFAVQEIPRIPREPHDIHLDWVVTERETIEFKRKRG